MSNTKKKMEAMKFCKNPRCGRFHNTDEVKRSLGKESAPYQLGYCSANCYTQHLVMKREEHEQLSNALHKEYQKAYDAVKPGQAYPQWFNEDQLKWIGKAFETLGVRFLPATSNFPPVSKKAEEETMVQGSSDRVIVRCSDGVVRFARYSHVLKSWLVEGCSGIMDDFVREFAYIFPPEQK